MFEKNKNLIFFLVVLLSSFLGLDQLLAQGQGPFRTKRDIDVGSGPGFVAVDEFNGDKIPESSFSCPPVETWEELLSFRGDVRYTTAWSPDGTRIAAPSSESSHQTVRIWDSSTGKVINRLIGHTGEVVFASWSPDGTKIASSAVDRTIRVWAADTGMTLLTLTGHTTGVTSVEWSPDGSMLASSSGDRTIKIWDAATGSLIRTLTGHTDVVQSVSWSPDGLHLVSGSNDSTVRIWRVDNGSLERTFLGHQSFVRSVQWSPDGSRIASGGGDMVLRIWEASTGETIQQLRHSTAIAFVHWSWDSTFISADPFGGPGAELLIWNATSGQIVRRIATNTGNSSWSPSDCKFAFTIGDSVSNDIHILGSPTSVGCEGIESWIRSKTLTGHTDLISSVAWSPDRTKIASGSDDRTINIWDATTGDLIRTLTGHSGFVWSVAWSPDGTRLASGSEDRTINIWDTESGALLTTLSGHAGPVYSVAWAPDGHPVVASGSDDRTIRIWDATTGDLLRTLTGHTGFVWSVAWSPDALLIASGSDDRTINLWVASLGRLIGTLAGHTGYVWSVAWSPDGSKIASGSQDQTVKVWDSETGDLIRSLTGHTGSVYSVAWSADGSLVTSGSADRTIKIWEYRRERLIRTLTGHTGPVYSVAWAPNGCSLASGSGDRSVGIWGRQEGCTPPPPGLVSWWPGDGTAEDIQDGNPGTLVGGVTYVPGMVGQAFSFNGTNGYVRVPSRPNLNPGTANFSIDFWIRTTSDILRAVMSKFPGCGPRSGWNIRIFANGYMHVEIFQEGGGPGTIGLSSLVSVNDGSWHHVALVRQATTVTFYIDGQAQGEGTTTGIALIDNPTDLLLGEDPCTCCTVRPYQGELDEIDYYSVALTESQVQAIYAAGSAGKCRP